MPSKGREVVTVETFEPGIAAVVIDSPPVNALTPEMLADLKAVFTVLEMKEEIRVVILTSKGSRSFVAGADVNVLSRKKREAIGEFFTQIHDVFNFIDEFPKPTICAIKGHATGNGCELAMVCDIRIASEAAEFVFPECLFGVVSAGGATQRLPQLIPQGRALYYLYTADKMTAREALDLGFADFLKPADDVFDFALDMARNISLKAPLTASSIKRLVKGGKGLPMEEALKEELESSIESAGTADYYEGITAYLEKRDPNFKSR